jgi:branched-chain amino acid transport system ATP-binding protein
MTDQGSMSRLPLPAGYVVAMLGRNGAGKSAALRRLAREHHDSVLIPDDGNVFGGLTVVENLRVFSGGNPVEPALAVFPALRALLRQRADTLSGGEQHMVALSHALLRPWRVLLVDELSRGLAAPLAAGLYARLAALAHDGTHCVVLAEPYPRGVLELADLVYVLRRGRLAFAGEAAELTPARLAALLG